MAHLAAGAFSSLAAVTLAHAIRPPSPPPTEGIVHRDVSSCNILVDGCENMIVSNMAIAKVVEEGESFGSSYKPTLVCQSDDISTHF